MSGGVVLVAGALAVPVVGAVLVVLGLMRTAAHADRLSLAHEAEQRARVEAVAGARTTSEGVAVIEGRLDLVRRQLVVWPGDPWLLQRLDQLLDERAALVAAAATQPRSRVVRQAAHP